MYIVNGIRMGDVITDSVHTKLQSALDRQKELETYSGSSGDRLMYPKVQFISRFYNGEEEESYEIETIEGYGADEDGFVYSNEELERRRKSKTQHVGKTLVFKHGPLSNQKKRAKHK